MQVLTKLQEGTLDTQNAKGIVEAFRSGDINSLVDSIIPPGTTDEEKKKQRARLLQFGKKGLLFAGIAALFALMGVGSGMESFSK